MERLIAFLAVQAQPDQRVFVAGTLWTDASEERANASLRTTPWVLLSASAFVNYDSAPWSR